MSEWCDVWWETMPKGQLRKFTPHMHVIKIFVSSPLPSMKCTPVTHNQTLLHCSGRYLRTVHPLWSLPFLTWSLLKCKLTIRKKKEAEEAWNEKLFPRRKWRAFAELPKLSDSHFVGPIKSDAVIQPLLSVPLIFIRNWPISRRSPLIDFVFAAASPEPFWCAACPPRRRTNR